MIEVLMLEKQAISEEIIMLKQTFTIELLEKEFELKQINKKISRCKKTREN